MAQPRPHQQALNSGGAQASTPRTFPTPASLTSGPEKLVCISPSSSLSLLASALRSSVTFPSWKSCSQWCPPSIGSLPHHSHLMWARAGEKSWARVKTLASAQHPRRSVEEPLQPVALGTGWPRPRGAMVSHRFVCQLLQLCGQIQEAPLGHALLQLEKVETEP